MILTGRNGAGKTNLLEALSFLAPGRGLRRARLHDVTCDSPAESAAEPVCWAVAGTVDGPGGSFRLSTGLEHSDHGGGRRVVRIDGLPARSQSALGEALSVIWLTPELDRLFTDGATARRRFLDRLVAAFDPEHPGRVSSYERTARERTNLLRNDRTGGRPADATWLAALERRMAETGVAMAAARREMVGKLSEICTHGIEPFPAARLAVTGETEAWLESVSALEAEDMLRDAFAAGRDRDREAGRALAGPHRSDLEVTHLGRMRPAAGCSTGEQKALVIGIVLAHARLVTLCRGAAPLLLLDEIAAHLDADRRAALFDEICSTGAQAWMTGTDQSLFRPLGERAQYFHVENAEVSAAGGRA